MYGLCEPSSATCPSGISPLSVGVRSSTLCAIASHRQSTLDKRPGRLSEEMRGCVIKWRVTRLLIRAMVVVVVMVMVMVVVMVVAMVMVMMRQSVYL